MKILYACASLGCFTIFLFSSYFGDKSIDNLIDIVHFGILYVGLLIMYLVKIRREDSDV